MLKIVSLSNGIEIAGISFPNNSLKFEIYNGIIINIYLVVNNKKIFSSHYLDFLDSSDQQYASPQDVIDDLLVNNNQPSGGGGGTAATTTFTPNGDISSTNVQNAIVEVRNDTDNKLSSKQDSLGFTPEDIASKSTDIVTDQASNTKYPSVKAVYDWAAGLGVTNLNNQRLGTIFTDAFTSAANYVQTQISGTQTFNSGYVTMTGGNNSALTNKMAYNYNGTGTLLDDHSVHLRLTPTANSSSLGPGVGMETNPAGNNSFAVFLNTSGGVDRGKISIVNPLNNTLLIASTLAIDYTNSTDTIELSFRFAVSKVLCAARNITTPTKTVGGVVIPNVVTLEYEWGPTSGTTPARISRPCVYTEGGTQNMFSLSMESEMFENPSFTLIGDSRAYGMGGSNFRSAYPSLMGIRGGAKSMVWARGGATATSLAANISELGTFFKGGHKGYVMIVAGVNDAIQLRTLTQFQDDYSSLLQAIINFGGVPIVTKIANVTSGYSNAAAINALINSYNTWLIGLPFQQVDENTILNASGTLNSAYAPDGVHYIDVGQLVLANSLNSQLSDLSILTPTAVYNGTIFNLPSALRIGNDGVNTAVPQGSILSGETKDADGAVHFGVNTATNQSYIRLHQNSTNYAQFGRYNSSFVGNFTGTSLAKAGSTELSTTTVSLGGLVAIKSTGVYALSGTTGTNAALGLTVNGLKIGLCSNVHTAATARLHLPASTGAASTGVIKFENGTQLATPESLVLEPQTGGANLLFTPQGGTVQHTLAKTLTATATLDFGSTAASSSTDLTITVTGAADGDSVVVTPPNGSVVANSIYTAWVSGANTVTVRFSNLDISNTADPASGTFRAVVFKY